MQDVERVAKAIYDALVQDKESDAWIGSSDQLDAITIDGDVNLLLAATAAISAMKAGTAPSHALHAGEDVGYVRGWNAAIEAAAKACIDQQKVFASPQYATGQPLSSFGERFACGKCAEEITALKKPTS